MFAKKSYYFTTVLLLFCVSNLLKAQEVKCRVLNQVIHADSSFYDIEKVTENQIWICGERGKILVLDTLGNLIFSTQICVTEDFLKIHRYKDRILVASSEANIYEFDLKLNFIEKHSYPQLKNKCIYDLLTLDNDDLLICGGHHNIAKAQKAMPNGYIAIIKSDWSSCNFVWKSFRKFVWSVATFDHQILATTYNGLASKVIYSKSNARKWRKKLLIKGLIHEINALDNLVIYAGSKNIAYQKQGLIGAASQSNRSSHITDTGCIWSFIVDNDHILAVNNSGELITYNLLTLKLMTKTKLVDTPLYEIEKVTNNKFIAIGHGGVVMMIDVNNNTPPSLD